MLYHYYIFESHFCVVQIDSRGPCAAAGRRNGKAKAGAPRVGINEAGVNEEWSRGLGKAGLVLVIGLTVAFHVIL